jgi:hypothetical protein
MHTPIFRLFSVHFNNNHHHHWHYSPLWATAFVEFPATGFLQGGAVNPMSNPQPGGPGLRIYDPGDRVTQLYPQALGTHFSRLLRHA